MYEKMLEVIKWWASHLLFTIIVGLSGLGIYQAYNAYQNWHPEITHEMLMTMDDKNLGELSKDIFDIQEKRQQGK